MLTQKSPTGNYEFAYGRTDSQGPPVIEQVKRDNQTAYIEHDPVTGEPLMLRTSSGLQSLYVHDGGHTAPQETIRPGRIRAPEATTCAAPNGCPQRTSGAPYLPRPLWTWLIRTPSLPAGTPASSLPAGTPASLSSRPAPASTAVNPDKTRVDPSTYKPGQASMEV